MQAAWYLMVWIPVAVLGCFASFGTLTLANALDLRYLPNWIALGLNIVPAFGCGAGCYYLLGRRTRVREGWSQPPFGHLRRVAPLYVIGGLLAAYIISTWSNRGFGLVAQLFVWPFAATLGGILGDLLAAAGPSVRFPHTAT
jgi:hypothetical protein